MFPTPLAQMIATKAGLLPSDHKASSSTSKKRSSVKLKPKADAVGDDQTERLRHFQQLSLMNNFEGCKEAAYFDYKLNADQVKALQVIHGSTAAWAKSKVIEDLLDMGIAGRVPLGPSEMLLDRLVGKLDGNSLPGTSRALKVKKPT